MPDEWDPETGLRIVRPRRITVTVSGHGPELPPWHPDADDDGSAGDREPRRPRPDEGGAGALAVPPGDDADLGAGR